MPSITADCREALAIRRTWLSPNHPRLASSLALLGRILVRKNNPHDAEPLLRESVAIYNESMPPGHRSTVQAQSELGNCLVALGEYEQAEDLLLESHGLISAELSPGDPLARKSLTRMVRLYEAWGKPRQAAPYRDLLSLDIDDQ